MLAAGGGVEVDGNAAGNQHRGVVAVVQVAGGAVKDGQASRITTKANQLASRP